MAATGATSASRGGAGKQLAILGAVVALVCAAIALDTTVVRVGSESDLRQQAFDPDAFGQTEFPRIQANVEDRAPDAVALATELATDKQAAIDSYGTMAGAFPVMPVTFSGVVSDGTSGIFAVIVPDMPEGTAIRVQTGPAINGTELRDVPGDISFGAFTNQIEYQDAGAGINRAMAADVLDGIDRDTLTGKTVDVTGVFTMINPANWLVTPVSLEVVQ